MEVFESSSTALVADVDCTAEGKSLCQKVGVKGYPSIKYGDPNDLQEYNGGRTFEELQDFALENLGPSCGPEHLDLCDEEKKALLTKYMAMPRDELEGMVKEKTSAIATLEKSFEAFVGTLEEQVAADEKDNAAAIEAAGDPNLKVMEAVQAQVGSCGPGDLEKCDAAKKEEYSKLMKIDNATLNASIVEKTGDLAKLEADFKQFVEGLQKQAKEAKEIMDKKMKAITETGLKKMEEVLATMSVCGPANVDICDDDKKAAVKKYAAMDKPSLTMEIKLAKAETYDLKTELDAKSKEFIGTLQTQYQEKSEKKDEEVKEIESSGLKLMQSVVAHMAPPKTEL